MDLLEYIDSLVGRGYYSCYGCGNNYGNGSGNCYGNGSGNGNGSGYGYGNGNGYGNSNGKGYGDGYGNGNGSDNNDGYGYGNGYGYGISELDGVKSYYIDGINTFLKSIHNNIGKGFTLKGNITKVNCYVYLTEDGFIAHGKTLREARKAAIEKSIQSKPIEQRLKEFIAVHPNIDTDYDDLFNWHYILTGSCEFGRKQWCDAHMLKPTDSITVRRFINETKDCYGGDIIKHLEELYDFKKGGKE